MAGIVVIIAHAFAEADQLLLLPPLSNKAGGGGDSGGRGIKLVCNNIDRVAVAVVVIVMVCVIIGIKSVGSVDRLAEQ